MTKTLARLALVVLQVAACGGTEESTPMGTPVAINCGFDDSPGNELGIGKSCTESSDCPEVTEGTALQCSTVLTENSLPLMCSRLCDLNAADPSCGTDAVCKNILELGYDLNVCVPRACQPLFAEPL